MTDWEVRGGPGAGSRGRAVGRTMRQGEDTMASRSRGSRGSHLLCNISNCRPSISDAAHCSCPGPQCQPSRYPGHKFCQGRPLRTKEVEQISRTEKKPVFFVARMMYCLDLGVSLHCTLISTLCSLWRIVFAMQQAGIMSMVLVKEKMQRISRVFKDEKAKQYYYQHKVQW